MVALVEPIAKYGPEEINDEIVEARLIVLKHFQKFINIAVNTFDLFEELVTAICIFL